MKSNTSWRAQAPSNIALIKYMGKTAAGGNNPTNASLSYTLPDLRSIVRLECLPAEATADEWEPLLNDEGRSFESIAISEKGQARFLAHLARLKEEFGYEGCFRVQSANDFPSDCGLASSASSFAALTMAALEAISSLKRQEPPSRAAAAELSRRGSGSSCRSFFSPWALWTADGEVSGVPELEKLRLLHQVVVVDQKKKAVSSSEAHRRVSSSALFSGRPERAEERIQALIEALKLGKWSEAYEISWAEFWDMHALFETSAPSFGYMTAGSLDVLNWVRDELWTKTGTGPLVTMDAGPNIHLLHQDNESGHAAARHVVAEFANLYTVVSGSQP